MEVKPLATGPMMMPAPAPAPAPLPAPAPVMPTAPIAVHQPHDHIHLHASYKHTEILMPEVKPVAHVHAPVCPPVVAPYAAWILVLFILLVIVSRSFNI